MIQLPYTDNGKTHTRLIPLPEDFLSDVQTDVHIVPVDTTSDTHKLLILLMSQ